MRKNKIKLIPILSLIMLFLFAIASVNILDFSTRTSLAQTAQSNENFYINVFDRSNNLLTAENEDSFNGHKAYIYKWENTKKFVLNFDPAKNIPSKRFDENNIEIYALTIEVQYKQGYYEEALWEDFKTLLFFSNTQTGENSYENFTEIKPEFNVDQGITGTDQTSNTQVSISTWGIYRFRMVINGQDTYSDYFIVEPTLEILEAPKITYKTTPSQVTLHNAYNFSLKNADKYNYIDKAKLTWYVLGESNEGSTYSLTFSDLNSGKDDFKNCSTALYDDWTRTGQTFYFDDGGISGEWKIWCEYNFDGTEESALKSNVQKVNTGSKFNYKNIVWIVLGVSTLFIIISILISIYKIKRERIY